MDICLQTLSLLSKELKEKCELQQTDDVQGQINKHIFAQNRGYCVYYPSNILQCLRKSFHKHLSGIFSFVFSGYEQRNIFLLPKQS